MKLRSFYMKEIMYKLLRKRGKLLLRLLRLLLLGKVSYLEVIENFMSLLLS